MVSTESPDLPFSLLVIGVCRFVVFSFSFLILGALCKPSVSPIGVAVSSGLSRGTYICSDVCCVDYNELNNQLGEYDVRTNEVATRSIIYLFLEAMCGVLHPPPPVDCSDDRVATTY